MLSTRIPMVMMAIVTSVSSLSHACAEEQYGYGRYHHEQGYRHKDRSFYGGNGLPSYVDGMGTYAGGLSAIRAPYSGIYLAMDRWSLPGKSMTNHTARPRIIHVNGKTAGAECSYEAGVCVIRP